MIYPSNVRFVQTPMLNIGYEEHGDASGFPIILLHGFPYDIRSFDGVIAPLVEAGHRVIVPYLRGYGPTSFLDPDAPRMAEQAAIASAKLIGRGDEKAADQAAVNAMRDQLNQLDIQGTVVIGEGERDEAPMLFIGEEVGTGKGPAVDIALDPLEGTTLTAKEIGRAHV